MNSIKKYFAGVQKHIHITICVFFAFLFFSCQNKNDASQQSDTLSDDVILNNLSENGKFDPKLLIGEWNAVAFAYTTDGKKISDRATIKSNFILRIPIAHTPINDDGTGRWTLAAKNTYMFISSLDGNLIELMPKGSTYIHIDPPDEEYDITIALSSAHSYVINDDEMIIYFPIIEDEYLLSYCTIIKNKNLVIFQKR